MASIGLSTLVGIFKSFLEGGKLLHKLLNRKCEISLNTEIYSNIPPVMNGGQLQNELSIQVRVGSSADLELIDAVLLFDDQKLKLVRPRWKMSKGHQWNDLSFDARKLPFVAQKRLTLKMKVKDHLGRYCELTKNFKMMQYPENPDIRIGRWNVEEDKGIIDARCTNKKTY